MNRKFRRKLDHSGFSMIDVMIAATLAILLASVTLPTVAESVRQAKADAAMNTVLSNLRLARQLAVDQRRTYRVTFTSPASLNIAKQETDSSWTSLTTNYLPDPFQYYLASEAPTSASASPDGIGATAALNFGGTQVVFFQPDGTATDSAGDTIQGVAYLGIPGKPSTARAVTIFGGTARTKGWRLSEGESQWEWSN